MFWYKNSKNHLYTIPLLFGQLSLHTLADQTTCNVEPSHPAEAAISGSALFAYAILSEALVYKCLEHLPQLEFACDIPHIVFDLIYRTVRLGFSELLEKLKISY